MGIFIELLSCQLQGLVPRSTSTLLELRLFLVDRFRNLKEILERWIKELEKAATTCQGGTRYRFEALVAALKFINRVTALAPEVPMTELLAMLAHPRTLARLQETYQHRNVEGYRQKKIRSGLSPFRGRGSEALKVLHSYLDHMIQVAVNGGFKFKYVIKSGEDPPKGASGDGESCKLLGYRWNPTEDFLSPGLGELKLNEKKRGAKAPNENPVTTREDAEGLLEGVVLTRQSITARIAELYDPIGM